VFGLFADAQVDPVQAADLRTVFADVRAPMLERLQRSIDSGELETDAPPEEVIDQITAPLMLRLLMLRSFPAESDAEIMVERGLNGIARSGRRARRGNSIS
jgi:hypothetical protein